MEPGSIHGLLQRWHGGDAAALAELIRGQLPWLREHLDRRLGPMLRNQYQFSVDLALLEQIAHGDVPD